MANNYIALFDTLYSGAKWDVGVAIDRSNALPLDRNAIFPSFELARAYAAKDEAAMKAELINLGINETNKENVKINNNAYAGQVLAVVTSEETIIYYIDANGQLQEVGGAVDLDGYVTGPNLATDNAIALYDGTTGEKIKNSGATIDANRNLKFNGPGNISWEDGSYYQRIQVTDDSTTETAVFTFQQTEDSGKNWNNLFTVQDRGTIVAKNPTGGALSLTLDRGNNANWRWLSDNGNFVAQCDYTSAKVNYFNVLTMAYNTGNVSVDKGTLTSKGGFIHSGLTAASGKTRNDYVLLAGGSTKPLSDFAVSDIGNNYLPLAGGDMTGPIDFADKANASGKNKNYISAGGGYGVTSGKEGLKILALNQDNARMGLGVNLTSGSYELTVATGRADNNTASKIGFATHTTGTTAYKTLGYFTASGAENPTVVFNVAGTIQENGTALGDKYQSKDDDLTAIAGLTGTKGFLKKTAANTWALEELSIGDTKNTAGATNNTGGPLYLIGAASQEANPQTYSNSSVSMNNGALTATSYNINSKATWQYNSSTDCVELVW